MGVGCRDRAVRRALPHAEAARAGTGRADEVHGEAGRAGRVGGSHERPEDRTTAVVQRVLDRRRRHGAARVRQLRAHRGLRAARADGNFDARSDRPGALRPDLSRRQSQDRVRTRRRRLPDLLRPERRWICARRGVSERPDAPERRRAARIGGRPGERGWRPVDHRHRLGARRPAYADQRVPSPHEDSGPADLVRRRSTAHGSDGRADGARIVARCAADPVPARGRAGESPPQGRVQLGHEAAVQRHREDPGIDVPGRMDRAREPSRRMGERRERSGQRHGARARGGAGARRAAQAGMDAQANHRLRVVGR